MDFLIGIGTVGLALFTALLAYATWRMAQAADRQATLSSIQVDRAHRPVLVPLQRSSENLNFRGGEIFIGGGPHISENPPDRPDLPRYSAALLAIENVGMGPALNVRGEFTAPRGAGAVRHPTEGVAVGDRAVVAFETWAGDSLGFTGNDVEVSAVLEYDDVAGRTYRTRVAFDIGNNAYRSELEHEQRPATGLSRRLPRLLRPSRTGPLANKPGEPEGPERGRRDGL